MNLQEQISRMKSIMQLITEDDDEVTEEKLKSKLIASGFKEYKDQQSLDADFNTPGEPKNVEWNSQTQWYYGNKNEGTFCYKTGDLIYFGRTTIQVTNSKYWEGKGEIFDKSFKTYWFKIPFTSPQDESSYKEAINAYTTNNLVPKKTLQLPSKESVEEKINSLRNIKSNKDMFNRYKTMVDSDISQLPSELQKELRTKLNSI